MQKVTVIINYLRHTHNQIKTENEVVKQTFVLFTKLNQYNCFSTFLITSNYYLRKSFLILSFNDSK